MRLLSSKETSSTYKNLFVSLERGLLQIRRELCIVDNVLCHLFSPTILANGLSMIRHGDSIPHITNYAMHPIHNPTLAAISLALFQAAIRNIGGSPDRIVEPRIPALIRIRTRSVSALRRVPVERVSGRDNVEGAATASNQGLRAGIGILRCATDTAATLSGVRARSGAGPADGIVVEMDVDRQCRDESRAEQEYEGVHLQ
jgi:hypothetical protein